MEADRLDMGFVTWQGQRVFVPWFGAPRIVPTADDEVQTVKLKYRLSNTFTAYLVVLFVAAIWFSDRVLGPVFMAGASILLLGVPLIFGVFCLLQRRRLTHWQTHSASRFSRSRFMLDYLKTVPSADRLVDVFWGGVGIACCFEAADSTLAALSTVLIYDSLTSSLCLILLGEGLFAFLVTRYTALIVLSFLPRRAVRLASKQGTHAG